MRKGVIILIVLLVVALGLFGWWRGTYNRFVQKDESVKAQLGQLNNAYQQRADLIPNLVETVKGSALAERQTLTDVISARSRASGIQLTPEVLNDPKAFQNFQAAQQQLTGALSRLMVVAEQYPELKSQENFTVLMKQIEGQENRIRVERNRYNDLVRDYNSSVRVFPSSMIASMSGFRQYPYFEAAAGAENAPKVDFNGMNGPAGQTGAAPQPQSAPAGAPPAPNSQPHGPARPAPVQR